MDWSEFWKNLLEVVADLTEALESFMEALKETAEDACHQLERRLAEHAGWDLPARLELSGQRGPERGVSVASGARKHTAATGE